MFYSLVSCDVGFFSVYEVTRDWIFPLGIRENCHSTLAEEWQFPTIRGRMTPKHQTYQSGSLAKLPLPGDPIGIRVSYLLLFAELIDRIDPVMVQIY